MLVLVWLGVHARRYDDEWQRRGGTCEANRRSTEPFRVGLIIVINTPQDAFETAIGCSFRSCMETEVTIKCGDWAYPCRKLGGILSFDAPNAADRPVMLLFHRPASACFSPR